MSSAIGYFCLVIFGVIIIFTGTDFSNKVMVDNNIHDATRTTQQSTLQDSIEIGEFIVNNELSINQDKVTDLWIENFEKNNDINLNYDIEVMAVHENPAGIVVNIKVFDDYQMLETDMIQEYQNIIIVDDGKE